MRNLNLVKPVALVCSRKITFPRVDNDIAIVVDVASGFSEGENKTDILSSLSSLSSVKKIPTSFERVE